MWTSSRLGPAHSPARISLAAAAGMTIPTARQHRNSGDTLLVRPRHRAGYARASYELNLGCNYDCEHCYLGEKLFAGMDWEDRERLLNITLDPGVLWLQFTGGEPLIDPRVLDLLTTMRPYRVTLSLYGATEDSYDGMTRRRGSFRRFMRGLAAAHEAGLSMRINCVEMRALAGRFGIASFEYLNISPTIHGSGEVLPSQAHEVMRPKKPCTGCNAGITHFHSDPHGRASICKVGREHQVDLMAEGVGGLRRLAVAGCALQKSCGTCMPLANLYRQAAAPLETYCQHGSGPLTPGWRGGES